MGFSSIIKTISGAGSNLLRVTGLMGNGGLYPTDIAEEVSNWEVDENDRSWQSSLGYGFKVVRVDADGYVEDADDWDEFTLQINPQDITQDEIFAIQVTPTFSGVMVEHQGVTLKDLTISGTTGISPGRRAGGAYPTSGAAVAGAGRSGYFEFHELRTYIRAYAEAKRNDNDSSAGELRLVWRNYKDKEDLFVEPQKFTMKRSSAKPMSYDYTIQLKAIGVALVDSSSNWFMGALETIDKVIQAVTDTIVSAKKILQGGIGLLETIEQDARNTILTPLDEVQNFLIEYKRAGKRLEVMKKKLARDKCEKIKEDLRRIHDNANDSLGIDTAAYNTMVGRTATLTPVTNVTNVTNVSVSYANSRVLNALKKCEIAMSQILARNAFFESKIDRQSADITNTYNYAARNALKAANVDEKASLALEKVQAELAGNLRLTAQIQKQLSDLSRSESKNNISNKSVSFISSKYMTTKIVESGHTIQTLALKYLRDVDAYRDLIVINNLSSPYVNPQPESNTNPRVVGVLMPGDTIYIPQTGVPKRQTAVADSVGSPLTYGQDLYEMKYGTDIQLTEDFDIALDVTGDAKLVSGQYNVAQALLLKILYEKNSLKRHPSIGTTLGIGAKTVDVRKVISEVRRSLSADSRVDALLASEVVQEGSSLLINAMLRLTGSDQPVIFPVRIQE